MEIIRKSNNPLKMWGFWLGFIIAVALIISGSAAIIIPGILVQPLGCNPNIYTWGSDSIYNRHIPWRSWMDGVYFGIESRGGCFNIVSRVHKYCSIAEKQYDPNNHYLTYKYPNLNFEDCLKNPNNYHFSRIDTQITLDNISNEYPSGYDGGRTVNISEMIRDRYLFFMLFQILVMFILSIIFGTIGWGIHSLIRKSIILFEKFKKSAI